MIKGEKSSCKCGSRFIVNKTYNLCDNCNYKRLHGETRFEAAKRKAWENNRSIIKSTQKTKRERREVLRKDRVLFLYIFNIKPHECEECGIPLSDIFEDADGNIVAMYRFSHILGKGAFPEFRHNRLNMNILCLECHQVWEFGDKKKMKIYKDNMEIIQKLKKIF